MKSRIVIYLLAGALVYTLGMNWISKKTYESLIFESGRYEATILHLDKVIQEKENVISTAVENSKELQGKINRAYRVISEYVSEEAEWVDEEKVLLAKLAGAVECQEKLDIHVELVATYRSEIYALRKQVGGYLDVIDGKDGIIDNLKIEASALRDIIKAKDSQFKALEGLNKDLARSLLVAKSREKLERSVALVGAAYFAYDNLIKK